MVLGTTSLQEWTVYKLLTRKFIFLLTYISLPLMILLIVMSFITYNHSYGLNRSNDIIEGPNFLITPLTKILRGETSSIPNWIEVVIMDSGTVYYPVQNGTTYKLLKDQPRLSQIVSSEKLYNELTIKSFIYKDELGFCLYNVDELPLILKMGQRPIFMIIVILLIFILISLAYYISFTLSLKFEELNTAIISIKNFENKTPIVTKDSSLKRTFRVLDETREELCNLRATGIRTMLSISHDLKTPLTSMRVFLEALRDGVIPEKDLQPTLIKALKKTDLLEERIDEILDFSQNLKDGFLFNREEFLILDWVDELHDYFYEEAMLYNYNYYSRISIDDNSLYINGNRKFLTRAIINLFDNACRYTNSDTPKLFTAKIENSSLIVTMEDGGEGIAKEDREIIFELFYRKDPGRNTRGMGIGLTSVKRVIEGHEGVISCGESELGGANFSITLPLKS